MLALLADVKFCEVVLAAAVAGWASAVPEAEVRVTLERSGYGAQGEFVLGSPRCFFMDPGQGLSLIHI